MHLSDQAVVGEDWERYWQDHELVVGVGGNDDLLLGSYLEQLVFRSLSRHDVAGEGVGSPREEEQFRELSKHLITIIFQK
jgi:hypothetical protein